MAAMTPRRSEALVELQVPAGLDHVDDAASGGALRRVVELDLREVEAALIGRHVLAAAALVRADQDVLEDDLEELLLLAARLAHGQRRLGDVLPAGAETEQPGRGLADRGGEV